jgi:hypothetical protein
MRFFRVQAVLSGRVPSTTPQQAVTTRCRQARKVHILSRDVPLAIEASLRANGPKRTETQRFITNRHDRFLFRVSQLQAAVPTRNVVSTALIEVALDVE